MAKFQRFEKDQELRREELIRNIEYSISQLSVAELESLYYDMMTKQYMGKNQEGWRLCTEVLSVYGMRRGQQEFKTNLLTSAVLLTQIGH